MKTVLKNAVLTVAVSLMLTSCSNKPNDFKVESQNSQSTFIEGYQRVRSNNNNPIISRHVNTIVSHRVAKRGSSQDDVALTLTAPEIPTPKNNKFPKVQFVDFDKQSIESTQPQAPENNKALQTTIAAGTTVTNLINSGGGLFIPADPHGAAGPNHVVNVFNTSIEFYQKDGTQDYSDTLKNFFTTLNPANFTFDPKVVYDQFEDRWVVVTLERTDIGSGDSANTSLVLIAISDDSDPNGNWTFAEINTNINIIGTNTDANGDLHWLDYPGLSIDEEAIYITGNMFQYFDPANTTPGSNGGTRVIIIDKGISGGLYGGGTASANIYDPAGTLGFIPVTQMPAQIYGSTPAGVGTWLVGYSGLAGSGNSAVQMIRIDNPLGATTFTQQFEFFGLVDVLAGTSVPDAPQSGTATNIKSGDRRVLDSVWRNNSLYFTTEVRSNDANNLNEATAFWGEIDTSNLSNPAFIQGNIIGGESDIGTGTYTSYPSIAVNADGGILVGFTASSSNMFPSSYYVHQSPTDPLNSMRPAKIVSTGIAFYVRTFGGPDNRWGDYSATSVDPDEACFWVYNKHAISQGTPDSGGIDEGRYGTTHAQFCNDTPVANTDTANVNQGLVVTTVNGANTSLISNDSDLDQPDDTLSMQTTAVSGPSNGSVELFSNGTFSYEHNNTASALDSFVYQVCDDGSPSKCANGTVNISINLSNVTPTANNDAISVDEGATSVVLVSAQNSVLSNDTDPDDLVLAAFINTNPTKSSAFTLNTNGTFSYTHDGSETITDNFTYDACDDEMPPACDTATVSITINPVNDSPIANNDAILVSQGATSTVLISTATSVLTNDTDADDQTLQATINTQPSNASAFTLNTDGTFSYTHDGSTPAFDSFIYNACDDESPTNACDTATVNITISPTVPDGIFADGFEELL